MQWHQLDHTQTICTLLQTENHITQFFTGWMLFLTPNQQRQSTEVTSTVSQRLKLTELGAAVA